MKIRTDFVTNSSSSSFTTLNIKSKIYNKLLKKHNINDREFKKLYWEEADTTFLISNDVFLTVCKFVLALLPYSKAICLRGDAKYFDQCENMEEINDYIRFLENQIADVKGDSVDGGFALFKSRFDFIKDLIENKRLFIKDASIDIASGTAESDSGFPDFLYHHLEVLNGKGSLKTISSNEDDDLLMQWAIEHGYIDYEKQSQSLIGFFEDNLMDWDFDENMYDEPPYEEMERTYNGVKIFPIDIDLDI